MSKPNQFSACCCVALILCAALPSLAGDQRTDFQLALLSHTGGHWNPRPRGLSRLAWEVRKRTSVSIALEPAAIDPGTEKLFDHPFVVWAGDQSFPPLSEVAIANLRQHLKMGGTLLVDLSDGQINGPFDRAVKRELRRVFPEETLKRVPPDHVLYKSFYLLDRHGGRVPSRAHLEGLFIEDRLAVIHYANDLAGAISRDEFGEWDYDIGVAGERTREMTFRLGINMLMYSLCLTYKEDQVHIPFILQRRK